MSNRLCNHCQLKIYQKEAMKRNNKIVIKSSKFRLAHYMNTVCIFEIPKNMEELPKYIEPNDDFPNGDEIYKKYRRGWMLEIPETCCCLRRLSMIWLSLIRWRYLLSKPASDVSHWTAFWCRRWNHPEGVIFYSNYSAPDMRCKRCNDDLG